MTTRVFLTGAGGFVGHHTLEHLLVNTDWDVVCTDSFRHRGKTDRIREVLERDPKWPGRVTVISHDLTVPFSNQFAEVAQADRIDYIINMASESHVDRSITDPGSFISNNVHLATNVFDFARRCENLKVLIQVSTDEVYGPAPAGTAHSEWADPIIPSNPYAASKAAQEAIGISYWRTYDLPIVISNTMNIIGERQDPEKFIPMTIKRVLNGEPMVIHASKGGTPGSRFYLHARNQADALHHLLTIHGEGMPGYGVVDSLYVTGESLRHSGGGSRPFRWHVVGEREVDNLTMAQMVADAVGKDLVYELVDFHSSRPGHDLRYALDGTKLEKGGWIPPVPLDESLERAVRWTLSNPRWLAE